MTEPTPGSTPEPIANPSATPPIGDPFVSPPAVDGQAVAPEVPSFAMPGGAVDGTVLPAAPAPRSKVPLILGIVGVLAIGLIAAGGYAAYAFLSGGGAQPEDVVPATAYGMLRIDLDPSAGQKLNVAQLALKVERLDDSNDGGSATDPAAASRDTSEVLSDLLASVTDQPINYETDVKPWIGSRAGVAAMPATAGGPLADDNTQPLVALATTDAGAAQASLERLFPASQGYAVAERDGYMLVGAPEDVQNAGPRLSANEAFGKAEELIGDTVAFGYLDIDTLLEQAQARGEDVSSATKALGNVPSPIGRRALTVGVTVQPDGLDLTGHLYGVTDAAAATAGTPVTVGANSVGVLALRGLGPLITQAAERSGEAANQGIDAAQIAAAVGDLAVIEVAPGTDGEPAVRGSITSSDLAATEDFWSGVGSFFQLSVVNDGSKVVISEGTAGLDPQFNATPDPFGAPVDLATVVATLPDAAGANVLLYVDVDKAEATPLGQDLDADERIVKNAGLSLSTQQAGDATLKASIRLN